MVEGIKKTDSIYVDLKMKQVDYNEAKIDETRAKFAKKYSIPIENVKVKFCPITVTETGERISLASDIIDNVHRPEFQVELERQWLESSDYEGIDFETIEAIDKEVNAFVDFDAYSKYKQYKFKYVKWDNFLSYGKGNFFDFTKLHGLVLLNGQPENQCGKTTFAIDLMRFALFGKSNKANVLDKAFNAFLPKETKVMVEACIEIDGVDYVIRRTLERPALNKRTAKSKIKQTVEYFKLLNGEYESIENCEGESNTATTNIIKEAVGSIDDFDLVISATVKSLTNLLEMGQSDKSRLFSKWLGLLTIEEKFEQAKKIWSNNSKKLLSNVYNKETISNEIGNIEACSKYNAEQIELKNKSVAEIAAKIKGLENSRDEAYKKRRPVDDGVYGLDVATIENNMASTQSEIDAKANQISVIDGEINALSGIMFSVDDYNMKKSMVESERARISTLEGANGELRGKIMSLREDNKRIEALMAQKICPTCGHRIDVVEQTVFIDRNKAEESRLTNEGVANKNEITARNANIAALSQEIEKMENDREMVNEMQKKILRKEALVNSLNTLTMKMSTFEKQKSDIKKNEDNIKHNNAIDIEINNLTAQISYENTILANENKAITELGAEIRHFGKEIDDRKGILRKLDEEESLIRHWNVYLEMVGKNGITKIVLRNALPILNNEIARLLDGICDFEAKIEMDEKNNVCMNLYKDGIIMDLGTCSSGFEGTVTSLALRSALGNISTMSKPSMLVLDELLGGVAASNYENVHELYNRIAANYQFILHITHNELISDWHNQNITVRKKDNVSEIVFGEAC